jgi:hypothetical protein
MIVEDQLDRRLGRIGGIEELEEFDEFAAAMTVPDQGMNLAAEKVDAGQQASSGARKLQECSTQKLQGVPPSQKLSQFPFFKKRPRFPCRDFRTEAAISGIVQVFRRRNAGTTHALRAADV